MVSHLSSVACLLNGIHKQDKTLSVVLNIRSKTSFISNIACILTIFWLNDALQDVVNCYQNNNIPSEDRRWIDQLVETNIPNIVVYLYNEYDFKQTWNTLGN